MVGESGYLLTEKERLDKEYSLHLYQDPRVREHQRLAVYQRLLVKEVDEVIKASSRPRFAIRAFKAHVLNLRTYTHLIDDSAEHLGTLIRGKDHP